MSQRCSVISDVAHTDRGLPVKGKVLFSHEQTEALTHKPGLQPPAPYAVIPKETTPRESFLVSLALGDGSASPKLQGFCAGNVLDFQLRQGSSAQDLIFQKKFLARVTKHYSLCRGASPAFPVPLCCNLATRVCRARPPPRRGSRLPLGAIPPCPRNRSAAGGGRPSQVSSSYCAGFGHRVYP